MPVPLQISMRTGDLGEDEVETHGDEEAEEEVVDVAAVVAGACTFPPTPLLLLVHVMFSNTVRDTPWAVWGNVG